MHSSLSIRRVATLSLVGAALLALLVIMSVWNSTESRAASPFVVNSEGDLGDIAPATAPATPAHVILIGDECTFRAAIEEANAFAGADVINFNNTIIPAGTTLVGSDTGGLCLPDIIEKVTIDGTTGGGFNVDFLNATSPPACHGLVLDEFLLNGVDSGNCLNVVGSTVMGLQLYNAGGDGIHVMCGKQHIIGGDAGAARHPLGPGQRHPQ